ncbi:MAG: ABC transporter permease [Planctomycetes bacterium]|nr:ABC transporter permease [Planctomycetota bacterium]MCC6407713.1 ABC transporter permease [Planctomycetota bacterium]
MSNKTWLVARREVLENIRTKGFWVGVLMLPIIMVVSVALPRFLEGQKEVRKYAVVDRSGWMLAAIDERAAMPDMQRVLREAIDARRDDPARYAEFPELLRKFVDTLDQIWDNPALVPDPALPEADRKRAREKKEDEVLEGVAMFIGDPSAFECQLPLASMKDALRQASERLAPLRDSVQQWWKSLPPEAASKFEARTAKKLYERIELPTGGEDEVFEALNQKIAKGDLFAYFVIGTDPVLKGDGLRYASANLTDGDLLDWFSRHANAVVRDKRLDEKDIDKLTAQWVQKPLVVDSRKIGKGGKEEESTKADKARQWAPMVFAYILWISIFTITQMLLTNTIEEKSSRIIEVLLSSVSPLQLMMGKIFGIAMTGLLMVGSWTLSFVLIFKYLPGLLAIKFDFDISQIATDPYLLLSFLVYFTLGYLFYASLLVGVGAACDTLKEAQNLMGPISVVMMIPIMAIAFLAQDPNSRLAVIMSYIPPFTPFVMMNRAAGPPTLMEYVTTTALLLVSIVIVMWAAAKVFRVGILMSGKAPSFKDIIVWIKAPVGQVPERTHGPTK